MEGSPFNRKTAVIGTVLLVASLAVCGLVTSRVSKSGDLPGVVVVKAAPSGAQANLGVSPITGPDRPPAPIRTALKLPDTAVLRAPVSAERMKGIVCGEVSLSGQSSDFKRFVYSGGGRSGAVDDGTDVFRKFADKICLLDQRR